MAASAADSGIIFTFDSDQAQIYSAAVYTAGLHDCMTVWKHGKMFVWLPAESIETVKEAMLLPPLLPRVVK
jgi:hypothetical protein